MDTAEMVVLVVGVLLIVFTLWFFFGARDDKNDEPRTSKDGPIYACPMHPWITSSDPAANCSICGMKLVHTDMIDAIEEHSSH